VLNDIGAGEILVLLLVALFIFGPDRLPTMAKQAGKALRDLRNMVGGIRKDLSDELGVDEANLSLPSLDPRSYVRKHVLEGLDLDDSDTPTNGKAKRTGSSVKAPGASAAGSGSSGPGSGPSAPGSANGTSAAGSGDGSQAPEQSAPRPAFDPDAT